MRSFTLLAVCQWLPIGSVLAFPLQFINQTNTTDAENINTAITTLQPLLSQEALLIQPYNDGWADLQVRGTSPRIQPNYSVVVEVATAADVENTVRIASQYNIPFLAVSGTHGWTKSINNLPYGIQINLRKLNSTFVNEGGDTATLGGGTLQYEATKALFAQNKQAVTGLCECVSVAGPLLAGGHSLLQARHGYSLDNIVSAEVVLANGTAVTASGDSNPDLFWALKGAGHNFGIVTSMQLKVYDIQSNWTVKTFIYTNDKLEAVLDIVNDLDSSPERPTNLVFEGVVTRIPNVDPNNPSFLYTVSYEGPEDEATPYFTPFESASPVLVQTHLSVDYASIYTVTNSGLSSPSCQRGRNALGSGASLPSWNTSATRAAVDIFAELTADARYADSVFLFENYGMQGVQGVDASLTSLSAEERLYPIMANPTIWWDGGEAMDAVDAEGYAQRMREALYAGLGEEDMRHTYVNYAVGTESVQQMYGYDEGRVGRLRELKGVYDPENRFGYYNPIAVQ